MILSTTNDKYLLLSTTKSKQISELSQKRSFNVSTRVIGYADSKICNCQQHMINICRCLRLESKQTSEFCQKRGFKDYTGVIGFANS